MKVIDVFENDGEIKNPEVSGLSIPRQMFFVNRHFRMDLRSVIGPWKKYTQRAVAKIIEYTGNKPIYISVK